MNKSIIFLIISTIIFVLSAVIICVAPIINNIEVQITTSAGVKTWRPSDWRFLNCDIFADQEKKEDILLDDIQKFKKYKNMCYRQKTMYGMEYSAFIINVILGFVCAYLALLYFLKTGKDFERKTGLIGIISGIIGFVMTLVYLCYSGYIFNNDIAYGILDTSNIATTFYYTPTNLIKLYPNGALYKWEGSSTEGKYITVYDNDKEEYKENLLYKDLGKMQYNYNSEYYETYQKNIPTTIPHECNIKIVYDSDDLPDDGPYINSNGEECIYLYYTPNVSVENKYIYDRWLTSLILAAIIVICNIILAIFGFLLFKNPPSSEETLINK